MKRLTETDKYGTGDLERSRGKICIQVHQSPGKHTKRCMERSAN